MTAQQNNNRKKAKTSQDLFVVSLLTLLAIGAWVGSDAYHRFIAKQATTVPENLLTPIDPKINMEVFSQLEERKQLSEEEIEEILGGVSLPEATPSPQTEVTPTPTATSPTQASPSPTLFLPQETLPTKSPESLNWPYRQKEKEYLL
jgi:CRISPR/Cas system endoribonuclease Cas6 (RAMP superfamily)